MEFRDRLVATLRAIQPVLSEDGVLVIGSEVPNLLEHRAASTLVVSQDVDVAVDVERHAAVRARLSAIRGLSPSKEEPSVWTPDSPDLIEVNFVGMDRRLAVTAPPYVLEDRELPLLVFGTLSFLEPGRVLDVDGVRVPLPRPAGLMLEKLVTDRTAVKGDRDLAVVLGLLITCSGDDLDDVVRQARALSGELRHVVLANLTVLSLMAAVQGMPDPKRHRALVARLLERIEHESEA